VSHNPEYKNVHKHIADDLTQVNDQSYIVSLIFIVNCFRSSLRRFPPLFLLDLCIWLLGCDCLSGLGQQCQERTFRHSFHLLSIINLSSTKKDLFANYGALVNMKSDMAENASLAVSSSVH